MAKAASVVRRLARNAATLFCRGLESKTRVTSQKKREQPTQDDDDGDEDEDEDDDELLDDQEEAEEDPKNLELLLSKSVAYQLLEETLSLFVHPDPVRKALFKIWPVLHPRDSPLSIEYNVEWEVPKFLASCFTKGQELGKDFDCHWGSIRCSGAELC
jgi:hypothetical protein